MPSNWVHQALSLVVFGLSYEDIHRRKDAYAAQAPGLKHRTVRHRTYQSYGRKWTFANLSKSYSHRAGGRITRWKNAEIAELHQVSVAHDVHDRIWDYEGLSGVERAFQRKCLEVFCAWLVLNPEGLLVFAQVDVRAGTIHRIIDGCEVWEHEPRLKSGYSQLRQRVEVVIRFDRRLRAGLAASDASYRSALQERLATAPREHTERKDSPT